MPLLWAAPPFPRYGNGNHSGNSCACAPPACERPAVFAPALCPPSPKAPCNPSAAAVQRMWSHLSRRDAFPCAPYRFQTLTASPRLWPTRHSFAGSRHQMATEPPWSPVTRIVPSTLQSAARTGASWPLSMLHHGSPFLSLLKQCRVLSSAPQTMVWDFGQIAKGGQKAARIVAARLTVVKTSQGRYEQG